MRSASILPKMYSSIRFLRAIGPAGAAVVAGRSFSVSVDALERPVAGAGVAGWSVGCWGDCAATAATTHSAKHPMTSRRIGPLPWGPILPLLFPDLHRLNDDVL